ncbi:hypothetical protein F0L74_25565 [Chitinophaga agrisoli]|uniref:Uncharacterized protein n=1 Tax=Chitinophaga agrisoli TaxID=2607653 RepID=A0A5B2VLI0_9BACT|nr:hypothetical protein [Chitinophaga agrisoli]KAA2239568.1 hypothetical protein F0L74_25565 [Chitinophaga agrisoli]
MRKVLYGLLLCAVAAALPACKKDDNNGPGEPEGKSFIRAKVDGKLTDFAFSVKAHRDVRNMVSVVGSTNGPEENSENIQLAILDGPAPVAAGTYNLDGGVTTMVVIYSIYKQANGGTSQDNYTASTLSAVTTDAFVITISSINDKEVKGTFGGTVSGTKVIKITEGEFSAPFE